jgi:hypothetical protein
VLFGSIKLRKFSPFEFLILKIAVDSITVESSLSDEQEKNTIARQKNTNFFIMLMFMVICFFWQNYCQRQSVKKLQLFF